MIITSPSIIYHGLSHTYNRRIFGCSEILLTASDLISNPVDIYYNTSPPFSSIDRKIKTLVLIHGHGGQPCDFDFIVRYLIINNPKLPHETSYNIYVPYLGDNTTTSIEDDSSTLHQRLQAQNIPLDNLILVGLSKGGLAASYFASHFHTPLKVITISSPMFGTHVADLHWDKNVSSVLGYMNSFLVDLSRKATSFPFYHIVPTYDHIIAPLDSCFYPSTPPCNIYHYDGLHSHIGITHSPDICDKLLSWISEP